MGSEFDHAKRSYDGEVDLEAAKLVEEGERPWIAMQRALIIVSERRQRKAHDKAHERRKSLLDEMGI